MTRRTTYPRRPSAPTAGRPRPRSASTAPSRCLPGRRAGRWTPRGAGPLRRSGIRCSAYALRPKDPTRHDGRAGYQGRLHPRELPAGLLRRRGCAARRAGPPCAGRGRAGPPGGGGGGAGAASARGVPAAAAPAGSGSSGSGGGYLDEAVVRGILFARLAGCVSGHTAVRLTAAERVAALLGGPAPRVPSGGPAGPDEAAVMAAPPPRGRGGGPRGGRGG